MKDISVGMYRAHMDDIPRFPLHEGFRFRPFAEGDAETWVDIQNASNEGWGGVTMQTFLNDFKGDEAHLADRSWFVVDPDGRDMASITAWWRYNYHRPMGLIHWVAVLPNYQGKGIGKSIMTEAMNRLAKEYPDAYLNTSTSRIPAIKVYLDFGFLPDMDKDKAEEAWEEVRAHLKHPLLGNA